MLDKIGRDMHDYNFRLFISRGDTSGRGEQRGKIRLMESNTVPNVVIKIIDR
jgi:hypothetical protein